MFNKSRYSVLLFAAATSSVVVAADLPKQWTVDTDHCYGGKVAFMKHSKSAIALRYQISGLLKSVKAGSPVGPLASQCFGVGSIQKGVLNSNGFCEFIDADGDKYFGSVVRSGNTGRFDVITGTGKFKGISGGVNLAINQGPAGLLPGTISGCVKGKGSFKIQ